MVEVERRRKGWEKRSKREGRKEGTRKRRRDGEKSEIENEAKGARE